MTRHSRFVQQERQWTCSKCSCVPVYSWVPLLKQSWVAIGKSWHDWDSFTLANEFTDKGSQRLSKRLEIVNLLATVNVSQSQVQLQTCPCNSPPVAVHTCIHTHTYVHIAEVVCYTRYIVCTRNSQGGMHALLSLPVYMHNVWTRLHYENSWMHISTCWSATYLMYCIYMHRILYICNMDLFCVWRD